MSQRNSGYELQERSLYETPEWVTHALVPFLPGGLRIWEPACGSGKMVRALESAGLEVARKTDLATGYDFLLWPEVAAYINAIITNPPFNLATGFIEQALRLMEPAIGVVAMLQNVDYDSAKTRRHLFGQCPWFKKKIVLTERIAWFVDPDTGKPKAAPSSNHAWYIWDFKHEGPPTIGYGP